ncbi:MAG: ABC transporter permease [Acetatifactor sp.]|nr:ABC transporter permease [Acetatifactor sp.]
MRNLLYANLHRLGKSRVFWGCEIVSALYALFLSRELYMDMKINGFAQSLDTGLCQYIVFSGIILAVFCSLFLGTELGDGTIRNKVMAWHRKSHIYLASLLICGIASLAMALTYLAVYLAMSIPCLLPLEASVETVVSILLSSQVLALAYCAIYTLIALLCSNKAVVSTACILVAFILFFTGIIIRQRLDEPESFEIIEYDPDSLEEIYTGQTIENSRFLPPSKRQVYEFLDNFLPGGQGLRLSGMMMPELSFDWILPIYSLGIILLATSAGLVLFIRKDLN